MAVTGLPFVVVGPVLSTLLGFAAMFLLFKLIDEAVGRWEAIVAVVATCFYIASPVFSAAYTESAALLLVVAILLLLRAQAVLVGRCSPPRALPERNVVIAMVPVIIAHAVVRWRQGTKALTRSASAGAWRWRPGPECSRCCGRRSCRS